MLYVKSLATFYPLPPPLLRELPELLVVPELRLEEDELLTAPLLRDELLEDLL